MLPEIKECFDYRNAVSQQIREALDVEAIISVLVANLKPDNDDDNHYESDCRNMFYSKPYNGDLELVRTEVLWRIDQFAENYITNLQNQ